ncbi:hypothetical protein Plhal304r1_c013g0050441 [Plasmopara halstedii]
MSHCQRLHDTWCICKQSKTPMFGIDKDEFVRNIQGTTGLLCFSYIEEQLTIFAT